MNDMLILISVLVASSVIVLCYGLYRRRQQKKVSLVERLGSNRPVLQRAEEMELNERFGMRVLQPFFRRLLARAGRLTPAGNIERLQHDLLLAGHPANLTLLDFLGVKLLSAALLGAGAFALLVVVRKMPGLPALLFAATGGIVGLYLPNFWLRRRKRARQKAIARALPDALDMLSICVDAGLGFEAALVKVGERWDNELTQQFRRVVSEIRMGVRRSDALRHMVERTEVPEVASFVAVLVQADRLGVGITNILHTQSEQARIRRRQRAEEEAHKAPIKMLIPMVMFIFPATFAVILGPAVPRFMNFFGSMGK